MLGQRQLAAIRAGGMEAHATIDGMWVLDDALAEVMVSHLDGRDVLSMVKWREFFDGGGPPSAAAGRGGFSERTALELGASCRCWGCAAHRPAWEFNYPDPLGLGPMEAAVVHVATGRMRLCIACEDKAVYAPERSKPQRTLFSNTHKRNPDAIDRPYWVAEVQERIDPGNLEEDLDDMKQINARYHGPTYHHVGYASHRYDSFKQLVHRYNKAFPDLPPMELTGPDRGVSSCHPDTNMRFVARRLFGNMHTALAPHF